MAKEYKAPFGGFISKEMYMKFRKKPVVIDANHQIEPTFTKVRR